MPSWPSPSRILWFLPTPYAYAFTLSFQASFHKPLMSISEQPPFNPSASHPCLSQQVCPQHLATKNLPLSSLTTSSSGPSHVALSSKPLEMIIYALPPGSSGCSHPSPPTPTGPPSTFRKLSGHQMFPYSPTLMAFPSAIQQQKI